ncbi:MAG: F0F1 ATP synthase subunit delta [Betaproteobacteria bacterium]|nr:F0F1 ATP synthase subunit delta [Betaproteobacteria bacterium]
MAEPSTVARPYAEAVFKLGDGSSTLGQWADMLAALSAVVSDARVASVINDPNLARAKVAGLILSILGGKLTREAENLVRTLAEYGRLELLPEIRVQFDALKNEREGVLEAQVDSAFELAPEQVGDLVSRLEKKFGRKVKARVSVHKDLIGGVRVMVGDKVIDGSARAQLGALENALKA